MWVRRHHNIQELRQAPPTALESQNLFLVHWAPFGALSLTFALSAQTPDGLGLKGGVVVELGQLPYSSAVVVSAQDRVVHGWVEGADHVHCPRSDLSLAFH